MKPLSFEQALRYCLENPDKLSVIELLNEFPEHREELEPLLAVDARLRTGLPRAMPPASKERMKRRLMERVAAQRTAEPAFKSARIQQRAPGPVVPNVPRWQRPVAAAVLISMLLALIWWGAGASLPGNPLYSVKLSTENLLLDLARARADLLRGHINLANVRLIDIDTMRVRGVLAEAGPAFDNYDYHIGTCLNLWNESTDEPDLELAKLIYASSVAGQHLLQGLSGADVSLPDKLQASIGTAVTKVNTLSSSTAQVLSSAGIDLNSVLTGSQGILANLLTAVPARPTPTSTTLPASPEPTVTSIVQLSPPTLTAVLYAAQTTVAGGGDARTPGVAAAETVIGGGPFDTPIVRAAQTVLALPTPAIDVDSVVTTTVGIDGKVTALPLPTPSGVLGTVLPVPPLESVPAATNPIPSVTSVPLTVPAVPALTSILATVTNPAVPLPLVGSTPVQIDTALPGSVLATATSIVDVQAPEAAEGITESIPVSIPSISPP